MDALFGEHDVEVADDALEQRTGFIRLQRDVTERRRRHTRITDELHQDGVLFLGERLGHICAGGVQHLHRDVFIRDP